MSTLKKFAKIIKKKRERIYSVNCADEEDLGG